MDKIKRVHLLSGAEVRELYSLPEFTEEERSLYFSLSQAQRNYLDQYRNKRTRVYFILQLGYFKAKQQFYNFDFQHVVEDTRFVLNAYFNETDVTLSGRISRDYVKLQKQAIITLFDFRDWTPEYAPQIGTYLYELLRYYPKGHSAFRQLLTHFDNQKIVIPSYRTIQDLFSSAFTAEEKRLSQAILGIPKEVGEKIAALTTREEGITQLNVIRSDQKDFQFSAVRSEITKVTEITDLYEFVERFIPTLKLSRNAVRYYADVAEQYAASRLRRLKKSQQWLYVMCFVYYRYQQIMDNLVVSFLYHMRTIIDGGKAYANVEQLKHSSRIVVEFPKLAKFLKWFPNRDQSLTQDELNQLAYAILPESQFSALAEYLTGNAFDKKAAKWNFYFKSSRLISLYLRPILISVTFSHYKKNSQLMVMIELLKTHYGSGKSPSKLEIPEDAEFTIPKSLISYLKHESTNERINPYLFEFFVYQKMYHEINRGRLCCNDSVSYNDIDHDLVDDALVDEVEKIAGEFGYPKIPIYCDERLDSAIEALDRAWDTTTENIRTEKNPGFQIKVNKAGQKQWRLLYDKSEKLEDAFFKTLPKTEIADMVMFVGDRTGMWKGFSHLKDRRTKKKTPHPLTINACILSEAFGFGTMKMAEMSDLDYNQLRATQEDFFRIETLSSASELVSNFINSLPIFKLWNLLDNKLLADADGQKFATSNSTIQSRYSKKYLGKGRGISLYTLIANFVAVNAKNIGLNEYEGHSLYDMVYGNKTEIDINSVTGDNHSLNKLNFVALDSIDVEYVPSIKNVREAANALYSVKPVEQYSGLLRPKGVINLELIKSQKRAILRVLLSLILQENTQTNLIRKLNSHTRYARLRAALYEYNQIFKSTHVLNLIDDMQLRKAIRTARNRTESYHQLQSAIRKIYHNIFKGKKVTSNRVSAHAARLVANCVVAYNALILNFVYEKMVEEGVSSEIINEFARISPIAWVHLFFTGRYSFKKKNGNPDVKAMAKMLEDHLKQKFWKDD